MSLLDKDVLGPPLKNRPSLNFAEAVQGRDAGENLYAERIQQVFSSRVLRDDRCSVVRRARADGPGGHTNGNLYEISGGGRDLTLFSSVQIEELVVDANGVVLERKPSWEGRIRREGSFPLRLWNHGTANTQVKKHLEDGLGDLFAWFLVRQVKELRGGRPRRLPLELRGHAFIWLDPLRELNAQLPGRRLLVRRYPAVEERDRLLGGEAGKRRLKQAGEELEKAGSRRKPGRRRERRSVTLPGVFSGYENIKGTVVAGVIQPFLLAERYGRPDLICDASFEPPLRGGYLL